MSVLPTPAEVVHFGEFSADLRSRELYAGEARVRVPDQSFRILAMLLAHPGELVTRDDIRTQLWTGDTFVDFDHGLNNAVNRLREALGDSAENPKYIETLPRRGYRLITPVYSKSSTPTRSDEVAAAVPNPLIPQSVRATKPGSPARENAGRKRLYVSIVLLFVISLAMLGIRQWGAHTEPEIIHALAVLPLEDLSPEAGQDYFADGITDALITNLAGIESLRVISRTSVMHYKGARTTLPQIAHELNVDAIVEGTVSRDRNRVRINLQLIDARNDRHLWAMAFDRDLSNGLALQAEVANAISDEVARRVEGGGQRRNHALSQSISPEAYESYLRGHYASIHGAFTPEGWKEARQYFNRAIQIEPEFTDAITGLAETYVVDDPATARLLAQRALEQNSSSAEAHAIVATVTYGKDWQFGAAEKEFCVALTLDPNSVRTHRWYGVFLAQTGRFSEAMVELTKAEQLDPLSPESHADLGLALYLSRRYDESIIHLNDALKLDPKFQMASRHLLRIYEVRNQIPEYIDRFVSAPSWYNVTAHEAERLANEWRRAYSEGGPPAFWRERLQFELRRRPLAHPFGLARIYAQLGDRDKAIAQLQEAYDHRDSLLVAWIKTDPQFDSLRSDPRFQQLLHKIGYPQ